MRILAAVLVLFSLATGGLAVAGEPEPAKDPVKAGPPDEPAKYVVTPEHQKAFEAGSYAMYVNPGKATVPSKVLGDIMWELMQAQYKESPADQKKLPPGYKEEDLLKKLQERVPQLPCVQVTAEEEENFKAGKFDEINNYTAYMDFNKILTQNKVPLPATIAILERERQDKGRLRGANLELALRISFMAVSRLYMSAGKPEKK